MRPKTERRKACREKPPSTLTKDRLWAKRNPNLFRIVKVTFVMPIYGLSYHKLVQIHYFQSEEPLTLKTDVVIALDHGQVLAKVVSGPYDKVEKEEDEEGAAASILREAQPADYAQAKANEDMAVQAGTFWKERVAQRKLDMKLVDVEVFLDRSKIIFYFTSGSRIDFRELVKDLVHEYRVRIEFRQIGVRHETMMVGAVGNCGRVCCCCRHLHQFAPVTIRMAKEQNIFLNPAKVSGICGRLLCCLAYEQDSYEKFHRESPRQGKRYMTSRGQYKVVRTNMFYNSVTAVDDSSEESKFSLDEWNAMQPQRVDGSTPQPAPAQGAENDGSQGGKKAGAKDSRSNQDGKKNEPRHTFVTGRMSFRQKTRKSRAQEAAARQQEAEQQAAGRNAAEAAPAPERTKRADSRPPEPKQKNPPKNAAPKNASERNASGRNAPQKNAQQKNAQKPAAQGAQAKGAPQKAAADKSSDKNAAPKNASPRNDSPKNESSRNESSRSSRRARRGRGEARDNAAAAEKSVPPQEGFHEP